MVGTNNLKIEDKGRHKPPRSARLVIGH